MLPANPEHWIHLGCDSIPADYGSPEESEDDDELVEYDYEMTSDEEVDHDNTVTQSTPSTIDDRDEGSTPRERNARTQRIEEVPEIADLAQHAAPLSGTSGSQEPLQYPWRIHLSDPPCDAQQDTRENNPLHQRESVQEGHLEVPSSLTMLLCRVCASPTVQLCDGCMIVGYCSKAHQEKDWRKHEKECHGEAGAAVRSPPPAAPEINTTLDRYIPGNTFEADAILIPSNSTVPFLVKATFKVDIDKALVKIQHFQQCFDKILGEIVPWLVDGQWDEEFQHMQTPSNASSIRHTIPVGSGANPVGPCFSLHCRPNGQRNRCYEALLSSHNPSGPASGFPFNNLANPGATPTHQRGTATPSWIDTSDPSLQTHSHLRGNGCILILKHPEGTASPQTDGTPVLDATLADLKLVVPYLWLRYQQRRNTGAGPGTQNSTATAHSRMHPPPFLQPTFPHGYPSWFNHQSRPL